MKIRTFFLLLIVAGLGFQGNAQDFLVKRGLRPLVEGNDTTLVELKRNSKGEIIKLVQEYYTVQNGEVFLLEEEYKKDKYWHLWRLKEVDLSKTKANYIPHGEQLHFSQEGRLEGIEEYQMGKREPIYKVYDYYPNGAIRFIAEAKGNSFWNFLLYKYPDGKDFSFGNFKDGKGDFIMLDDSGAPCLECTVTGNRTKRKYIRKAEVSKGS